MINRAARAFLAFSLIASLQMPVLAQVRPISMPSMAMVPGAPAASIFSGTAFGVAPTALQGLSGASPLSVLPMSAGALSAPAFVPLPAAAAAPVALAAAPVAAPALAAVPAASVRVEKPAKGSLTALTAAPVSGAPALSSFQNGRQVFDGAALSGPAVDPAPAAAPAPRGDAVQFAGQSFPTRMYSDQTQISSHLIRAIDATKNTLDIAIYELAIREVHDALKRAKDRGVKIRIVMDEGHVYPTKPGAKRTPEVQAIIDDGFAIKTLRGGDAYGIMHNKFAVFDGAMLETGSFNWSRAADTMHFENALFDDSAARIASYQNYWNWMWSTARTVDLNNPPAHIVLDEHGHSAPMPPAPQDAAKPIDFNGTKFPRESFTPHGTASMIAAAIDASKTSVDLANFSFTNAEIIEALKRAKDRGLKVRLIFDRYQYGMLKEGAEMTELGFDVRLSDGRTGARSVMHNKFGVFDGQFVETGSFNWTMNGELNNYENAVYLDAPDDAAGYAAYFQRIWNQARVPTAADHRAPTAPHDGGGDALTGPVHPLDLDPRAW
jgi:phosphatidylserine/phosphatidylglycerophosphate/cardiolipin synthase-like enzyme